MGFSIIVLGAIALVVLALVAAAVVMLATGRKGGLAAAAAGCLLLALVGAGVGGVAMYARQRHERARVEAERVVREAERQRHVEILRAQAATVKAEGRPEEAIPLLEEALKLETVPEHQAEIRKELDALKAQDF